MTAMAAVGIGRQVLPDRHHLRQLRHFPGSSPLRSVPGVNRRLVAIAAVTVALLAACGSSKKTASTTTTASPARTLDVLVTNDDGFDAPGLDAVVEAVRVLPNTRVTVVAPATNKSGQGDKTTPGTLVTRDVKTASGYAATSVDGFPADTITAALDQLRLKPDLVLSGANQGQNIGPFAKVSGTVGAAKAAARRGIPALAASTGIAPTPDYAGTAKLVVEWVQQRRAAVLARSEPAAVTSLNVPTCTTGARRGLVTTTVAADFNGRKFDDVRCDSTKDSKTFVDDVDAFLNGYATLTPVPLT